MGNVAVKTVIHFGAGMMMTTILLCYTLAVQEGHVNAWLPTISACGALPIEKYFFRYGLLSGAMLLVVLALYIYTADFPFSKDRLNVTLGVTAGLALGVVAICSYMEDHPVHNCECNSCVMAGSGRVGCDARRGEIIVGFYNYSFPSLALYC